ALARRGAGINRLFRRLQGCTARLDRPRDVLKIADTAGETVDPRHHEDIALPQEIEHGAQFLAPLRAGAAPLLGSDDLAPGSLQRGFLDRQVLVGRADASVADYGHPKPLCRFWL